MGELLGLMLTFIILCFIVGLMVFGARPGGAKPKVWSDLGSFDTDNSSWAVAALTGLAVAQIQIALTQLSVSITGSASVGLPEGALVGLAFLTTGAVGLIGVPAPGGGPQPARRAVAAAVNALGAFAAVLSTVMLIMTSAGTAGAVLRVALMIAFGFMFLLFALARPASLPGLMWFSMLEILTFSTSQFADQVLTQNGIGAGLVALGIVALWVMTAFMPQIFIPLMAVAATVIEVLGMGVINRTSPVTSGWLATVVAVVGFMLGALVRKIFRFL